MTRHTVLALMTVLSLAGAVGCGREIATKPPRHSREDAEVMLRTWLSSRDPDLEIRTVDVLPLTRDYPGLAPSRAVYVCDVTGTRVRGRIRESYARAWLMDAETGEFFDEPPVSPNPARVRRAPATPSPPPQPSRPAAGGKPVTDATTLATAKKLVGKLLNLSGDEFRVSLVAKSGPKSLTGEARDLKGQLSARFGLEYGQNGFWVSGFYAEGFQPAIGKPMDIAKAEARTKAIVAALYPRWKGRHMLRTQARQTWYAEFAPGKYTCPPAYAFGWTESPKPGLHTRNMVDTVVRVDNGSFLVYSARLAPMPLKPPTVTQAQARKVVDTELRRRYPNQSERKYTPMSAVCRVGGPKEDPVWYFEHKVTGLRPDGKPFVEWGDALRVHGLSGKLMASPTPPVSR
jgi:hypothetical protein